MAGFVKLYGTILKSTVWREPHTTVRVWIALLACADAEGIVESTVPGLADDARVTREECLAALATFLGPDEWSRTKDHEGRRIEEVEGGWLILNHAKYRERTMTAAERVHRHRVGKREALQKLQNSPEADAEADAEADQKQTKIQKKNHSTPTPPQEGTLPGIESESREHAAGMDAMTQAATRAKAGNRGSTKKRETPPAGLAEHVLTELQRAARALPGTRTGPDRITPGMLDSLAKLHASEQPTAEEWSRVVARRAALDREGDGFGALTWEHLCRPASFRRYRDGGESPTRPQAHQRGPAPVSSRPTESRTATVRELMREDEAREAAARGRQP